MFRLPATFRSTRDSLRALACYAISPARKARTGRIGLRPVAGGFGTPPFDDGVRIVVRGDQLACEPGDAITISTVRAAAGFLGVELSADPGVGDDLPPYTPDADLAVDAGASTALGEWYGFGEGVLSELAGRFPAGHVTEAQLWPEHFDYAVTVTLDGGAKANVGFSPGDGLEPDPYVYVGPHGFDGLGDDYWNAPFGAVLRHGDLLAGDDPDDTALAFIATGLQRLA